jgi:hypothetical protein
MIARPLELAAREARRAGLGGPVSIKKMTALTASPPCSRALQALLGKLLGRFAPASVHSCGVIVGDAPSVLSYGAVLLEF